ncbi:RNA polymerase sigma factor [Amycolatopsis sp. NPDC004378]
MLSGVPQRRRMNHDVAVRDVGCWQRVVTTLVSIRHGDGRAAAGNDPEWNISEPVVLSPSAALEAARDGDDDAFRVLYRAVQPGLLRYLGVLVGHDAEDVASEAWLQVARNLGKFRGELDGFRGWVATIARHRAIDHLRNRRRRPVAVERVEEFSDVPGREDTAGSAVEAIGTDAALALIAELPREQAEAVLLRVVMGLDAPAAAKVLGKRPGAVRTAAYRGLRTLAERLPPPEAGQSRRSEAGVTETKASTLKEVR